MIGEWLGTRVIGFVALCTSPAALLAASISVTEVTPGVFVHQGVHEQMNEDNSGAIGNSGFIVGNRAVAVIDPGGSLQSGRQLRRAIESVTTLPIEYVFLTHFHPDHVIAAAEFNDVANIIAHRNYPRAMLQRSSFYVERFGKLLGEESGSGFTKPTQLVDDSLTIDLGNRLLIVRSHPTAHTDNDLTVFDKNTNALWAGDLVFAQRTPSLDGSLKGWQNVISELEDQQYALVIPGHGKPGTWAETVVPQTEYLADLRRQVKAQINAGKRLSDVIKGAELLESTQWKLYGFQHPTNLTKAYTELEWD